MNIFGDMEILWSPQNSTSHKGVISMHFIVFSDGQGTELEYDSGLLEFKYCLVRLIFLVFFGKQ